jgi:hypothetical protein
MFFRFGLRTKLSHVMPSRRSLSSRRLRICSGDPERMWTATPAAPISRSRVDAPGFVRFSSARSKAVRMRSFMVSNSVRR